MPPRRSPAGDLLTELVMKVFRMNGRFLEVAESLTEGSGLTAARWQVLGAVLREPLTVAAVARQMGLARQSVQRLADALVEVGMCEYLVNPAHARAKLLAPTNRGRAAIEQISPGQTAWANRVSAAVGAEALAAASAAFDLLLAKLERSDEAPTPRSAKEEQSPERRPGASSPGRAEGRKGRRARGI